MRKESQYSLYDRMHHGRLYREQIESILQVLLDAGLSISISSGEYVFDDLDDLKENRGCTVYDLTITGKEKGELDFGSITIYFHKGIEARISASSINDSIKSSYYEVRDVIKGSFKLHQRLVSPLFSWFVFSASMFISPIISSSLGFGSLGSLIGVLLFLLLWFFSLYWSTAFPCLILERHHEASSFWRRNRDKIILMFIGGIVGAIITFCVKSVIG